VQRGVQRRARTHAARRVPQRRQVPPNELLAPVLHTATPPPPPLAERGSGGAGSGWCPKAPAVTAMQKSRIVTCGVSGWEIGRTGPVSLDTMVPVQGLYSHVHVRRERLGRIHRSRTVLCRPVPNPSDTIRNCFPSRWAAGLLRSYFAVPAVALPLPVGQAI
jgi:hypothetical protein